MSEVQPDSDITLALLERIRDGDRRAIDEILRRQRSALRGFVDCHLDPRLRQRIDASDVVQDTQLELMKRMDDYLARRPMPFRLWARKQAYERIQRLRRDHLQRARRSINREVRWPEDSSLLIAGRFVASSISPSARAAKREVARRVGEVVAQLADADREVLLLRHSEDLPYAEIGCLLDIEPAAARKRYGRALIRLQRLLNDHGLLE